jgi:hypothetical protein
MKGVYVTIPVWGSQHIEAWLRRSLPSLLAPGNLPALAKVCPVKLLLCTTREDIPQLFGAPAVKALRDIVPVRAVPMADRRQDLTNHRYQAMNRCHNYALGVALQDDFGIVPGLADFIYAEGSLEEVGRHIADGRRAALTQGLTVTEETFDDLLVRATPEIRRTDTALSIPPRTLVRLARHGLHALGRSQTWGAEHFTVHPSILYWPLGERGFLMRTWHIYPAFLYPDREAKVTTTIDGTFLDEAISDLGTCAILDDSDRYFFISLAAGSRDDFIPREVFHADPAEIARWLPGNTKPFNREMIKHKFWLHEGIDRRDWQHVEAASDAAIAATLDCFARAQAGAAGSAGA